MGGFELRERDGLARIGRFETPHGRIETPALLPVVHPDPARQPIPAAEIRSAFGLTAVISSSYIAWRSPELRTRAEREGIHGLLGFDGPVMTDSGAFQQHAYGHVEVDPLEILEFQNQIGSDIATVLDIFVEPEATREEAENGVRVTDERARQARIARPGLLAVPVQGGGFPELRSRSAALASEVGDVLAIGGIVPLFERYQFAELARVVAAARPDLGSDRVVHLFGTGHPMVFAFAALLGADLYDSSSYHKFARRGRLMFPEGTIALDDVREPICQCALCAKLPLTLLARQPVQERERGIAEHNLRVCAEEMARVRQAIRDGTLWELAERRVVGHPALRAGLAALTSRTDLFLPTEPRSRRAFRETGPWSRERPSVVRFQRRLASFRTGVRDRRRISRIPLVPEFLARIPTRTKSGEEIGWIVGTPLGDAPLELAEVYPVGPCLSASEFDGSAPPRSPRRTAEEIARTGADDLALDADHSREWDALQARALLEWEFGALLGSRLLEGGMRPERSRRTGRLRLLRQGDRTLYYIGNDGLAFPTFHGAEILHHLDPTAHRVSVNPDAAPFVREGRSLFARFAGGCDPTLVPGDAALLSDDAGELIAVGRMILAPHELLRMKKGVAVRVTGHRRAPDRLEDEELPPGLGSEGGGGPFEENVKPHERLPGPGA